MKPILNNRYGYKICYTEKPLKKRYVTQIRVHSFRHAMKVKREYVAKRQRKRDRKVWHVIPITKAEVKRGIWNRPF